jgi:hypothetical protein
MRSAMKKRTLKPTLDLAAGTRQGKGVRVDHTSDMKVNDVPENDPALSLDGLERLALLWAGSMRRGLLFSLPTVGGFLDASLGHVQAAELGYPAEVMVTVSGPGESRVGRLTRT